MLLTYSLDRFEGQILSGEKIHTLREDPHKRWKPGMSIQHWRGNPRNTHAKVKPYCFLEGECKGVQEVRIHIAHTVPGYIVLIQNDDGWEPLSYDDHYNIARNDGLTIEEFREWFVPEDSPVWDGWIIHFTDFKY